MPGNEVEGMDQDRKTRLEEGGINLSGALERFMGNEPMLERYLGKFLTEKVMPNCWRPLRPMTGKRRASRRIR